MLRSQGNRIFVEQSFEQDALLRMLAALHSLTEKKLYEEIHLDFSACDAAFAGPMLAVCSQVLWLHQKGILTHLTLPNAPKIARLFHNTNWAHLMDPEHFAASDYRGRDHVAAIRFTKARDQQEAVTRLVDTILETTTDLERGDLAAIEWALNEITDNVLTHAESSIGGIVQLSRLGRKKLLEIAVVDHGRCCGRARRGSSYQAAFSEWSRCTQQHDRAHADPARSGASRSGHGHRSEQGCSRTAQVRLASQAEHETQSQRLKTEA